MYQIVQVLYNTTKKQNKLELFFVWTYFVSHLNFSTTEIIIIVANNQVPIIFFSPSKWLHVWTFFSQTHLI